ncbi:MAG TPA: MFS transporter [Steroidobacteraceae bacterium]|nr:MFS transporter [Steroidobacteraceae bacterium]
MSSPNRRVLLASLVGSAIEWFDFFLYGSATPIVFNRLFFPATDPFVSLLLAYLSFALPFFIRPLGGVIFSHIGDRVGRKRTLVLTLSLMGGGTALIGFLPTYADIGVAAPVLLVLLRLIQGIGLGGEWGGAVLLAYEYAPPERRGFFGSIPQSGVTFGMLLSTLFIGFASSLPDQQFLSWGWRVPFILSAGLVALGLWIRSGIDETPDFTKLQTEGRVARFPVLDLLRTYRREVLTAILVKFGETGSFYMFAVFLVSYATTTLGYSRATTLTAIAVGAFIATAAIPLCGLLSDRFSRRTIFMAGCAGLIAFSAPYFWLLSQRSTFCILVASAVAIGLIWPLVTATLSTLLAEMFQPEVRYSGISVGYQIGGALVGGTAPLVGTLLLAADHGRWRWIACYIAGISLVSFIAASRSVQASRVAAERAVVGAA